MHAFDNKCWKNREYRIFFCGNNDLNYRVFCSEGPTIDPEIKEKEEEGFSSKPKLSRTPPQSGISKTISSSSVSSEENWLEKKKNVSGNFVFFFINQLSS